MCLLLLKHAFLGNFSSMQNIPSDLSKQQEGSSFPNAFSLSAPLRPQGKLNFWKIKLSFLVNPIAPQTGFGLMPGISPNLGPKNIVISLNISLA